MRSATRVWTAILAAATLSFAAHGKGPQPWTAPQSATLVASSNVAQARTRSGEVQGFVKDGITTFRGIPYAKAERFEEPVAPTPWQGVRQAITYGNICPQPVNPQMAEPQAFLSDWRFWPQSENCLNLNVWTPRLDGAKRPVMVWLHGGGFFSGSSIELPVYDGTNLSHSGDVVVVSVNHRLNALGFLDLSAYGEPYKSSGNVGMLDIVAALQWVYDNIAQFGGDPDNVTIFGQSGGGGKVVTLLGAPAAQGLFQKAIVMSGVIGPPEAGAMDQKTSRRVAELVFKHAGLANGDVTGLKRLSYDQLSAASSAALEEASRDVSGGASGPLGFPRINWGPVVDHAFLPAIPFVGSAPSVSAGVPLLIGSTLNEFQLINPRLAGHEKWTGEQTMSFLRATYGARTDALIAAFRRAYPDLPLSELPAIDTQSRGGALAVARLKATEQAPVYNYIFAWRSPILDHAWEAGHSMDISFAFDNAAAGVQSTGGGPQVDQLAAQMSRAWINFARSGNPNAAGLPDWASFTPARPATMIFGHRSRFVIGHDAELISLLSQVPTRR